MSCVRSNLEEDAGKLGNIGLLHVALTRANKEVIIVGNAKCLAGVRFYINNFALEKPVLEELTIHL